MKWRKRKKKVEYRFGSFEINSENFYCNPNPNPVDFMSNFGMIIPTGSYVPPKDKKTSKWKQFICWVLGHEETTLMITTTDSELPKYCKRCLKWKCKEGYNETVYSSRPFEYFKYGNNELTTDGVPHPPDKPVFFNIYRDNFNNRNKLE